MTTVAITYSCQVTELYPDFSNTTTAFHVINGFDVVSRRHDDTSITGSRAAMLSHATGTDTLEV